ncbi:hypothetical protein DPMN_021504 [Dreissena polymorpha]|uniref:Uncharacterized protein n=1 Tax=Dreissena polymorpha TaxID=45954 RepID=A0A9D4SA06_DREPO|nr:hypothetical protein DPMN_021504 [Dreissena polymorpha]
MLHELTHRQTPSQTTQRWVTFTSKRIRILLLVKVITFQIPNKHKERPRLTTQLWGTIEKKVIPIQVSARGSPDLEPYTNIQAK